MTDLWNRILNPSSSAARTEALRTLLETVRRDPSTVVPVEVERFLAGARLDEAEQAALVGLVILALHPERGDDIGVLARIFPALRMKWEPELQSAAVAAFRARSPREVFDRLADLFADESPERELDRHYAYCVLGSTNADLLSDDAVAYAAA